MNNKWLRRLLSLVLAVIIIAAPVSGVDGAADDEFYIELTYAEELVFNQVQRQPAASEPSQWAYFYVFMAREAYGLCSSGLNYQGNLTDSELLTVTRALFEARVTAVDGTERYITRGRVIEILYQFILDAAETGDSMTAAEYFAANGLMRGRTVGDYQLNSVATVEELIAFSVRAYEHMLRVLGHYSRGFFWEIQGVANTVYLLGSIHIGDGSLYPMSSAIEAGFANSRNLAVEFDIGSTPEAREAADDGWGVISPGAGYTIRDLIPAELYATYSEFWSIMMVPPEVYDYFYPWMAVFTMQYLMPEFGAIIVGHPGFNLYLGIDMYFMRRAALTGRNIISLESAESRAGMTDSFSPELQESMLYDALAAAFYTLPPECREELYRYHSVLPSLLRPAFLPVMDGAIIAFDGLLHMMRVISAGDDEALEYMTGRDTATDDVLTLEFNYIMLTERDRAMAAKIHEFLISETYNGNYFVIVGAAHMTGATGLIQLLTDKGHGVVRR